MKTFLQKAGETLYMPNLVFHSVWNMSPTLSVGNNPLHDSSFVEQLGSGEYHIAKKVRSISGKHHLNDVNSQIHDSIVVADKMLHYKPPKSATSGYSTDCLKDTYYNWSLLKKRNKNKKH